jgi:uncharacterized protein YkwD
MKNLLVVLFSVFSLGQALAQDAAGAVSSYRRQHGLPGVSTDPALTRLAHQQASAMARSGSLSHSAAGPFASRVAGRGNAAENIAMGTNNFSATLAMWKSSSGHNANLLRRGVNRVGVASATGSNGRMYWALILAGSVEKRPALTLPGRRRAAGPRTLPEW